MVGFGSFGIIPVILTVFGCLLIYSTGTAIFAAICFYGFWYAVKNSPTLRTRRFMIGAAIDFNLLIWAIYMFRWFISPFIQRSLPKSGFTVFGYLSFDFNYLCFFQLPILGVYSFFLLCVILRWRKILYEDLSGTFSVPKIDAEPGEFRNMTARAFETERRWVDNFVRGFYSLQDYLLTATGLRTKRNITVGMIAVGIIVYAVLQTRILWYRNPDYAIPTDVLTLYYYMIAWGILMCAVIQALFFRIVSFGMKISESESALEQTPPKFGTEIWNPEELSPKSRRRILFDAVILLAAIPLCMLMQFEGWGIVRKIKGYFEQSYPFPLPTETIESIFQIEIVLVALAVLWGSRCPNRRFLGYSLLFLVSGLTVIYYIEWTPFNFGMMQPLHRMLFWWVNPESQSFIIRNFSMNDLIGQFYYHHLFSIMWLIYSLLASVICYRLHRCKIK